MKVRLTSRHLALTLGLLVLGARAADAQSSPTATTIPDSVSLGVVRSYFAAYNDHNVEQVLRLLSPDFVWLSVADDSVIVEVSGAAAIRASLSDYLRRFPTARSDIEAATSLGPWVTVRERAHWQGATGPRSQASISVYEVRDGLLRRVWYYPVVRE